ncbi:MAG: ABC transporter ATP-binding protein [Sulfolobales archaeon]|nr:energy-coupling factor ABC transporter ATP-binding protein [Sulfolobales archaeon]MDW7969297.1 ABC transporter ATP-binding protein [Sulfolobales archaeon]
MEVLTLKDIWFRYPASDEYVLKGVNLRLNKYELSVIRGPNGSGKSTLLLVAAGLLTPEKGEVLLYGKPLNTQLPQARIKLGITFQDPEDQFFNATVYDEIAFALRQLRIPEGIIRNKVTEVVETLNIMHLLNRPPYKLSGGEKVRVALASVLVYDPEILLLDEPTAYLTTNAKSELMKLLENLRDCGKTIVVVTNDSEVIKYRIDESYLLDNGVLYNTKT